MSRTLNTAVLASVGTLTVVALAACGSNGTQDTPAQIQSVMSSVKYSCEAPNNETMTNVSVVALPIVSNGAIYAGVDQGFFEKHGLKIDIQSVATPPAAIAAVQGGTADFAFTTTSGVFQAVDQGIPLTIVAPFAGIAPDYWDKMQAGEEGYTREITALLVDPKSGIKDPGDLNGKTVAVADAKGQFELTTRHVIEKHGGDPDSVSFTVMNPADAANALMAGKVDAAATAVPQMLEAEKAGYKVISWIGVETFHEGPTSAMISSNDFVLKNAETTARFNCAIQASTAYANDNPDVIRQVTAREQKIDPAALASAVVPYYYDKVDMEGLERFHQIMAEQGFVSGSTDLKSIVIPQALK